MIGTRIILLDRVDSTNSHAECLTGREPVEEGTVIMAVDQYSGRGQQDHVWQSQPGKNLTLTVVLRPSFIRPESQFLINKAISLAAADFITGLLQPVTRDPQPVSIKWPNDIYIGLHKAGGILIEHRIMGDTIEITLAGIGLNINQLEFPPELPNPVSLAAVTGQETDLPGALTSLCSHLNRRYDLLRNPFTQHEMDAEYDTRLLGHGQWQPFTSVRGPIHARITGVNSIGQLVVETKEGETLAFNHGEIEYIV